MTGKQIMRVHTAVGAEEIDAGYPGAGLTLPTANGNITTLYAPAKDGNRSLAADAFSPATVGSARAEYDNDYYWQATGQRAASRGGGWRDGAHYGLFCLNVSDAPSHVHDGVGFRGVC